MRLLLASVSAAVNNRPSEIPVIDLFAGPGGLGEGFSAVTLKDGQRRFRIALSVEKDAIAHATLELRAFFRQGRRTEVRKSYNRFLRGELTRGELFSSFPQEAAKARTEAWHMELSPATQEQVAARVKTAVQRGVDSILIGGPPCQAYSLVGRSRNSKNPHYSASKDTRHILYHEYLRVLSTQWPCVFVMENVKGLLSARYDGQSTFERILEDLHDPLRALQQRHRTTSGQRYTLVALTQTEIPNTIAAANSSDKLSRFIVKSEEHGVPQRRHRVIIVGVRENVFSTEPLCLESVAGGTTRDALADLPPVRSGLSDSVDSQNGWEALLTGMLRENWYRSLVKSDGAVASEIEGAVARAVRSQRDRGAEFIPGRPAARISPAWFHDTSIGGFSNHSARAHMSDDLRRYSYAAAFAGAHKRSPTLSDFPPTLLPDHQNVGQALRSGMFADRFRVQAADREATTITSHISKDGHYYIHYDGSQCRSLTVREAARLQTFPDSYFFCGPRTAQYHQVGNAVPPILALKIAQVISDYLR